MSDCIFCKIASGEIPAALEHQDEQCVAFRDLNPQAPLHLLVIPRRHVASVAECSESEAALAGHLMLVAAQLARQLGAEATGYRVVVNTGRDGGQTVPHLHLHLLAGRSLSWPPG